MALLWLFYRQQEQRRTSGQLPLVDMQLLAQRRFALGTLLVLLVYSTASSFFLCFALLAQPGLGLDPLAAGMLFAPCSVGFMAASLAAPRMVSRFGAHRAILRGAVAYTLAIGMLMLQVYHGGVRLVAAPWQLAPVLVVLGAGQGVIMTPLLNLVLGLAPAAQAGMASGVVATVQQLNAALGVAVVGVYSMGHWLATPGGCLYGGIRGGNAVQPGSGTCRLPVVKVF